MHRTAVNFYNIFETESNNKVSGGVFVASNRYFTSLSRVKLPEEEAITAWYVIGATATELPTATYLQAQ